MFIMGTAGHIDHGKSTLITALTGINPDRLQEERFRGMTVDLGFAWFALPAGNVGVIDVPGHQRLVRNMLAGIGQLDLVLLVVAADDGWMPQTQEHVDILHLHGVKHGIVALTKADLVEPDWLELVQADVREHLDSTALAAFPIIPVSAATGQNLDSLKEAIDAIISSLPPAADLNDPLLWIDRVFTIKGAGTIVTGTLVDGSLELGSEVMVQPLESKARIRGLQTQNSVVEKGLPHTRLAVNLTGIEKEELFRGMYLALPGKRPHYSLINAHITMLPHAVSPLENNRTIKVYAGTHETLAQVKTLGAKQIRPGESGFAQLILESPAHFHFKDRFILRHSELQDTLGGGEFIEEGIPVRGDNLRLVGPKRLQHLFPFEKPRAFLDLQQLERKYLAEPNNLGLFSAADRTYWTRAQFLQRNFTVHPDLIQLGEFLLAPEQYQKLEEYLINTIAVYHRENPLEPGPAKETLRTTTGLPSKLFDQVAANIPAIEEEKGFLRAKTHRVRLSAEEEEQLAKLLKIVNATPYQPLSLTSLADQGFARELIHGACHLGLLILMPKEELTTPEILVSLHRMLFAEDAFKNGFELAVFRDRLETSRKHALTFLEYFDAQGITKRKGDIRQLGKRPQN